MRSGPNANRRAKRRATPGAALPRARPGAEAAKSLAKALGPDGQKLLKAGIAKAANKDHAGAAATFRQLSGELDGAGKSGLAARAMLRAARTLYIGGDEDDAMRAVEAAAALAKKTGNGKAIRGHFQRLVQRVRRAKGAETADRVEAAIREGLGVSRLGRNRGRKQGQA